MQRLPRLNQAPCEEEEGGAAPGHGGSTAYECGAGRPAAVKYAGGAAAVTHRRRPLSAAPPSAFRERDQPRPAAGYLQRPRFDALGRRGDPGPEPPASPRGVRGGQDRPRTVGQQVPVGGGGAAPVTRRTQPSCGGAALRRLFSVPLAQDPPQGDPHPRRRAPPPCLPQHGRRGEPCCHACTCPRRRQPRRGPSGQDPARCGPAARRGRRCPSRRVARKRRPA